VTVAFDPEDVFAGRVSEGDFGAHVSKAQQRSSNNDWAVWGVSEHEVIQR
jgi:hypothetical protein